MAKATGTAKRLKRSNGEGTIYEDKATGRCRVMLTLPTGQRLTARVLTRAAAVDKLREFQAQAVSGLPAPSSDHLAGFLEYWLSLQDAKVTSGDKDWKTAANYRWALRPVIEGSLGRLRLRELEPEDVDRLLAELAVGGMARRSVLRVRAVLGQALDFALRRGKVVRNVARLAEMPATAPPPAPRSLDEAQARQLETSAAMAGPFEQAFIVTGLRLGLRPGELLGLIWDDIDFEAHTLAVTGMLERGSQKNGGGEIRRVPRTKTKRQRPIAMPAVVEAALRAWRKAQAEAQLAAAPVWSNPDGLVFTSEIGTPIYPSNMDRRLAAVTAAAGLEGRWSMTRARPQDGGVSVVGRGMPLEEIADQFGHANTRMLQAHYRNQLAPNDRHLAVWERFDQAGQS